MKAPEKIYLQDSMSIDTIGDLWPEWLDAEVSDNSIEYIRTDVFIENAIGWIDYNNRNGGCNFDGWEKDFKNYMKGE